MSEVTKIVIGEGKEGGEPVQKPSVTPASTERPAWLPEKFKTPEDMAKSYSELEAKMGNVQPVKADKMVIDPSNKTPDETYFNKFTDEFVANGKISDESYAELAGKGYNKTLVDGFIAGQQAIVDQARGRVFQQVGGEEAYQQMIQWAADNLDESEINAYNRAIKTNDTENIKFAINGLKARYDQSKGPKTAQGGNQVYSGFANRSELAAAIRDPKYKSDPSYRRMIEEKARVSQF